MRRRFIRALGAAVALSIVPLARAQGAYPQVSVYMNRNCGCRAVLAAVARERAFIRPAQFFILEPDLS
jgi:hypothetical protein